MLRRRVEPKLATAVGMMNAANGRRAKGCCYSQRRNCQPRIDATPQSISNHTPRPSIENGGEINETGCYCDVGEVGNPKLVRRGERQVFARLGKIGPS